MLDPPRNERTTPPSFAARISTHVSASSEPGITRESPEATSSPPGEMATEVICGVSRMSASVRSRAESDRSAILGKRLGSGFAIESLTPIVHGAPRSGS
jgi:hypothetical protein